MLQQEEPELDDLDNSEEDYGQEENEQQEIDQSENATDAVLSMFDNQLNL